MVKTKIHFNALQLLNTYRIVQESLQNVVKYASASTVKIIFQLEAGNFVLKIVDDGKGFDNTATINGNGLANMQRRCEECNGKFLLKSGEMGTEVICEMSLG